MTKTVVRAKEAATPSGPIVETDRGMMTLGHYVGLHIAQALRDRGIWRPGTEPHVVFDRMRDMHAISGAAIEAVERFRDYAADPANCVMLGTWCGVDRAEEALTAEAE